jgi:sulfate transport system ATP-binding protein
VTTVFVTHDQEEALEVADEIVVINDGRIEQIGTPDELYDDPANDFVMGFLGPVTRLGGRLVRPHDLIVERAPESGTVAARVTRLVRVGFEVRVELAVGAEAVTAVVTRAEARHLELVEGATVFVGVAPGATTVASAAPAAEPVLAAAGF